MRRSAILPVLLGPLLMLGGCGAGAAPAPSSTASAAVVTTASSTPPAASETTHAPSKCPTEQEVSTLLAEGIDGSQTDDSVCLYVTKDWMIQATSGDSTAPETRQQAEMDFAGNATASIVAEPGAGGQSFHLYVQPAAGDQMENCTLFVDSGNNLVEIRVGSSLQPRPGQAKLCGLGVQLAPKITLS